MGPENSGRYRRVVAIRRWSLTQVRLYRQTRNYYQMKLSSQNFDHVSVEGGDNQIQISATIRNSFLQK